MPSKGSKKRSKRAQGSTAVPVAQVMGLPAELLLQVVNGVDDVGELFTLLWVCQAFRRAVLDSRAFSQDVVWPPAGLPSRSPEPKLLEVMLSDTSNRRTKPLRVTLVFSDNTVTKSYLRRLFEVVRQAVLPRVTDLELDCRVCNTLLFAVQNLCKAAPKLRTLKITTAERHQWHERDGSPLFRNDAPKLQRLIFDGDDSPRFRIGAFDHVTHLTLRSATLSRHGRFGERVGLAGCRFVSHVELVQAPSLVDMGRGLKGDYSFRNMVWEMRRLGIHVALQRDAALDILHAFPGSSADKPFEEVYAYGDETASPFPHEFVPELMDTLPSLFGPEGAVLKLWHDEARHGNRHMAVFEFTLDEAGAASRSLILDASRPGWLASCSSLRLHLVAAHNILSRLRKLHVEAALVPGLARIISPSASLPRLAELVVFVDDEPLPANHSGFRWPGHFVTMVAVRVRKGRKAAFELRRNQVLDSVSTWFELPSELALAVHYE